LEDWAVKEYEKIATDQGITINWATVEDADSLPDYIEKWRCLLWDHAFYSHFRGTKQYSKKYTFLAQDGTLGTVNSGKRLLYRYLFVCI
jgi:hypothetical protein